jgi:hypothetical protein
VELFAAVGRTIATLPVATVQIEAIGIKSEKTGETEGEASMELT